MKIFNLLFALILVASVAHANDEKSPWSTKFGAGALLFEMDEETESGQMYEVRQGYNLCDKCTLEFGITGGPFFEGQGVNQGHSFDGGENWSLGGNIAMLHHINGNPLFLDEDPSGKWDPYAGVVAGAFWYQKRTRDGRWDPYAGLEAGSNYFINDSWSVGGDYRLLVVGENTQINHQLLFTLGYYWGASDAGGSGMGKSGTGVFGVDSLHTVYFDFDKSYLTKEAQAKLDENAKWLAENKSEKVQLEGSCDERGTNEYNLALGDRRSQSAYEYLRAKGIPAEQMSTISYGEEKPAVNESNEAAWAKNRRVETIIK